MPEMKTTQTDADPTLFLSGIEPKIRAEDAAIVIDLMSRLSGELPRMWGTSLIGFGAYTYSRADGSQHRSFRTGLSPRKAHLVIYIVPGFKTYSHLLAELGPHKHSVSCLYITRLARVDQTVLETLIAKSLEDMAVKYPK